ncbi:hypothetical protein K3749_005149 [Escherichia coli]|nr:hypothetical protein [Escherichia coli]
MNYRAEATPHGVNIMTRNDAGMYDLTDIGREIWQSMVNDMGATVAGGNHA